MADEDISHCPLAGSARLFLLTRFRCGARGGYPAHLLRPGGVLTLKQIFRRRHERSEIDRSVRKNLLDAG